MERAFTAVALGLFDGVHLGHRAVLEAACRQRENGLVPSAFTFEPESVLHKSGGASGYIYGQRAKIRLLNECGIERVSFPPFETVRGLSGEEFAEQVLRHRMNAAFVCCGRNFRFGSGASCGVQELEELGKRFGFKVQTVEDVQLGGETVSSSSIRTLLADGEIERANALLGEPYTIYEEVSHGAQIGRTIGFPTANQVFAQGQLVPRCGVYSSETFVNGQWLRSMTNVGIKPTVNYVGTPLAETYILDFSGNLYGETLSVRLLRFIRPERKFDSVEQLKAQIAADIEKCR